GLADVVQINPAAFEVLSRLPFRWTECGVYEQINQRRAGRSEFRLVQFLGWHLANNFVEGAFGNTVQLAAEKNFTGANRFRGRIWAVHKVSYNLGQRFVSGATLTRLSVQVLDCRLIEKREEF